MRAITSGPLAASRTADVAVGSSSSTFSASASSRALVTASTSARTPSSEIAPPGVRYRISRSTVRLLEAASGRPPGCASATSRWTVLDPMSSTPSRMRSGYRGRALPRSAG